MTLPRNGFKLCEFLFRRNGLVVVVFNPANIDVCHSAIGFKHRGLVGSKLNIRNVVGGLLVVLVLFMVTLRAIAAESASAKAFVIPPDLSSAELTPYIELLEDSGDELSFEQISRESFDQAFFSVGHQSPNFGFTTSAWWVRVRLQNPSSKAMSLVLRQDYPLIDYLDIWQPDADGWQQFSTGDRRPFASRPIDHRLFLFPVEIPAESDKVLYLRYQTQGAMNIGLFVHNANDIMGFISQEYLALGVYYGGFMVLLIYNLIMFITFKERAFAHYLAYVLSYGLYMSVHNGLSFQFLWPNNTWLANSSLLILLSLSLNGALQFTRSILRSQQVSPRADKVAALMQAAAWICLGLSPLVSYHLMVVPLSALTLLISIHLFVMGILALRAERSWPAIYYIVAFSALLLGVVVYMLKTFGLLPHNVVTQNAFQIGSLIEMVLLSLAVASRLSEFKRQTYKDALTQLNNRRSFDDHLSVEFARALAQGGPLSLVVLDIDRFKSFNDRYGHTTGDQALKTVADILAGTVRKPNMVFRYGGEEFVMLLPNAKASEVPVLCERIRHSVASQTKDSLQLTVSVGFAVYSQERFSNADMLFQAADFALYTAKSRGRNCVVSYAECDNVADEQRKIFNAAPTNPAPATVRLSEPKP